MLLMPPSRPRALTERQSQVLEYICRYQAEHQTSPTIREIAAALKVSSLNPKPYTEPLEKKGYITVIPNISRGIKVTEKARAWYTQRLAGELPLGSDAPEAG